MQEPEDGKLKHAGSLAAHLLLAPPAVVGLGTPQWFAR